MTESSVENRPHRPQSVPNWLIVILLAVIATCLLIEVGFSSSTARAQGRGGATQGVFAVAGQITTDTYGMYLVDLDHGTICVYRYDPNARRLALLAARTYLYDVQLDEYNSDKPLPREVKEMIAQQRRLKDMPTTSSSK